MLPSRPSRHFVQRPATDKNAEANLRQARASEGESRVAALAEMFLKDGWKAAKPDLHQEFRHDGARDRRAACGRASPLSPRLNDKLAHLRMAEASAAVLASPTPCGPSTNGGSCLEVALDYDDLIDKAQNLLSRADAASWVLYKIDGGIDHILVDEAQDTNPAQWTIIESLAAEFFAGAGQKRQAAHAVRGRRREAVDLQFPGREPAAVRRGRPRVPAKGQGALARLARGAAHPLLPFDRADPQGRRPRFRAGACHKRTRLGGRRHHHAPGVSHRTKRGWSNFGRSKPRKPVEPADAFEPWNEELAGARSVDALARRIATTIKTWLDRGEELPAQGRNVKAGDILILVRRRDPFTTPMIRELKRLGVPVAGADRMKLTDQLAVQDLMALADVLLMPEDDLALAVVLKSPLFGFDDDDLVRARASAVRIAVVGAQRQGEGRAALCRSRRTGSRTCLRVPTFCRLTSSSPSCSAPTDSVLRKRMLTRLGPEAAEAIDEFLDLALAYDRDSAPSLQGFVNQLRAGDVEIKRDMEQERDEVRIMTVHGAKGLQAPIVFLPDTCTRSRTQGPRLYPFAA